MAHGGYHPDVTPSEFPELADHEEHRQWLRGERTDKPQNLSTYYTKNKVFDWIDKRNAVIVNAVAYRTPEIKNGSINDQIAKLLPSREVHRNWLREEVLPDVKGGKRLVVVHHPRLWDLPQCMPGEGVYPAPPHLRYLPNALREKLDRWLRGHGGQT